MSKKLKVKGKKKSVLRAMRDRYWKQAMVFAEQREWQKLCEYVDVNPWLATAYMGPTILPDYLASEKEYGLLRLLCNVEDVPVSVIRHLINFGAKDRSGRAYLERLLVGTTATDSDPDNEKIVAGDSPFVAAAVLRTCDDPVGVIDKMQTILEEGLQDQDSARKSLARRCIDRSQLFFDLMLMLYENDAADKLLECLGRDKILQLAVDGKLTKYTVLESVLMEQ